MSKRCTECEEYKDFGAFGKNKNRPDGHHHWCKECRKAHDRQPLQKLMGIYNQQVGSSKIRGHQAPTYSRDEL